MKRLLCALFAALALTSVRGDMIANGDFHDGKANWKGDLRAPGDQGDRGSYDMSSIDKPADGAGVIVTLKPTWTRIYQTFDSHDDNLDFSITYKVSDDYAPAHGGGMGMPTFAPHIPGPPGQNLQRNNFLSMLLGGDFSGALMPPAENQILVTAVDLTDGSYSEARFNIVHNGNGSQTATGSLLHVPPSDEKTLYLVFPGGKGTLTLLNVALMPKASAAAAPDNGLNFPKN